MWNLRPVCDSLLRMLAGKYRLSGTYYIERVKKHGKLFQFKHFALCIQKRDDNDPSRYAFVVSTKVSKLAVDRNRIKRMMSETVRFHLQSIENGYNVVFLAKKSIMREPTEKTMNDIKKALIRTNLIQIA